MPGRGLLTNQGLKDCHQRDEAYAQVHQSFVLVKAFGLSSVSGTAMNGHDVCSNGVMV